MNPTRKKTLAGTIGVLLILLACWMSLTVATAALGAVSHWFGQPDSVTGDKSWAIHNREWLFAAVVFGRLIAALMLGSAGIGLLMSSIRPTANAL